MEFNADTEQITEEEKWREREKKEVVCLCSPMDPILSIALLPHNHTLTTINANTLLA